MKSLASQIEKLANANMGEVEVRFDWAEQWWHVKARITKFEDANVTIHTGGRTIDEAMRFLHENCAKARKAMRKRP